MKYMVVFLYKGVDLIPRPNGGLVGMFVCPNCGKEAGIDAAQLKADVSTVCPQRCGFHVYLRERREWMPYRLVIGYEDA